MYLMFTINMTILIPAPDLNRKIRSRVCNDRLRISNKQLEHRVIRGTKKFTEQVAGFSVYFYTMNFGGNR